MSAFTSDDIFKDDYDDQDFIPSGGSNLAAIFGIQPKGQDSLSKKTTPKKSAVPTSSQSTVANKTKVIIAKAVHAFKLQNGQYISIGKLGIALTGNTSTKTYQIILYKSKQYISVSTLTHDFSYVVQPNNYSSYYDVNNENWSILFENSEVCTEFAREVGLARYFLREGKRDDILYQDLTALDKDGNAIEGSSVSIKYFVAVEITQPFKGIPSVLQSMTVEISMDDNWERNLLGTNRGLKRVLFLPPNKQIGLGPSFPKEKDIMLEIEILNISSPDKLPSIPKNETTKASILSRVAKMGQSMLPKLPISTTTDSEDTEEDVPHKLPRHKKVETMPTEDMPRTVSKVTKSRKEVPAMETVPTVSPQSLATSSIVTPAQIQWSPTQIQPNYMKLDGETYIIPRNIPQPTSAIMDPNINMLLSETRMSNTEIRMGINKIADNVQKLLDKFHNLELQTATTPTNDKTVETMVKVLHAMNVSQVGLKNTSEADQKQDENFLLLVKEKDQKIAALEAELQKTKESLTDALKRVSDNDEQKIILTQTNNKITAKIEDLERLLKDTQDTLKTTSVKLDEAQDLADCYAKEKEVLNDRISELVNECDTLKSTTNQNRIDTSDKSKEIKHIMNKVYHTLLEKFIEESYSTSYIKSTIANTIKSITLQVLHEQSEENDSVENTQAVNVNPIISNEPPPIPPIDTEDDGE